MIVDIHTHFMDLGKHCDPKVASDIARCKMEPWQWEFSAEDHDQGTAAADIAVVFGIKAVRTGWDVPNEFVAAHVRRSPERLIFFASIDPGQPGYMDELEHCHQDLDCRGVKLGPIYQGVHPLDKRYYDIYCYCERQGLPVITHMATTFSSGVPLEYARPLHMDQVASDFPKLRIVLAHMGHPWEPETIAVIRKQPNVYADVSALYYRPWQFYSSMRLLVEYAAQDKVLFGSDFPATTTADSINGLRNVNAVLGQSGLPQIPSAVIEDILFRDSLELLGVPKPVARQEAVR